MILWLNGPFGVGKTATARFVEKQLLGWRLFDPEWVGYMLRANLADWEVADFQDLPPWRALVPQVARQIMELTGDHLLVVQTVLREDVWNELQTGFAANNCEVTHVVLHADDEVLRERIVADEVERDARDWRLAHADPYRLSRLWLSSRADLVVDTTNISATDAANLVIKTVRARTAP